MKDPLPGMAATRIHELLAQLAAARRAWAALRDMLFEANDNFCWVCEEADEHEPDCLVGALDAALQERGGGG